MNTTPTVLRTAATAAVPGLLIGLLLAVVQLALGVVYAVAAPLAVLLTGLWVVPAVAVLVRGRAPLSGVVASTAASLPVGLVVPGFWAAVAVGVVCGAAVEGVVAAARYRVSRPVVAGAGAVGGAVLAAGNFGGVWLVEPVAAGTAAVLVAGPVVGGVLAALAAAWAVPGRGAGRR